MLLYGTRRLWDQGLSLNVLDCCGPGKFLMTNSGLKLNKKASIALVLEKYATHLLFQYYFMYSKLYFISVTV